jgi:dienelactone hydrolase
MSIVIAVDSRHITRRSTILANGWCIAAMSILNAFAGIALAEDPSIVPADDAITDVACSTTVTSVRAGPGNLAVDPGDYHYRVYLPARSGQHPGETFPCLFVFSPSGNARLGNAAGFVKRERWTVILLVESRNGPTAPQMGNFLAAYDDAIKRFRIQPGMIFATGQSGGARSSLLCAELRPGFGGVLLQAAGSWLPPGIRPDHTFRAMNPSMAVYGLFGDTDMNRSEAFTLRRDLPGGTPYRWDVFTGGHTWAPAEAVDPGLSWLQRQALLHGTASASMRAFAVDRVLAEIAVADSATASAWERYQAAEFAHELIAARSLGNDAKLKTAASGLGKRLTDLTADAGVRQQLTARSRFEAIAAAEQAVRSKPASSAEDLKSAAATAAGKFAKLAAEMPDTDAGRDAKRLAGYRVNEAEAMTPTH